MHAIRVARAHTNRDKIIKFEGSYHGAHDYVMWSTPNAPLSALGSAKAPSAIASSSGIPNALNGTTLTLPFNDFEMLEKTVKDKHGDIAAIIVEPIMGNLAATMPAKGWLQHIRKLCDEYGIVMILDEVKTGFRIAPGGRTAVLWGAGRSGDVCQSDGQRLPNWGHCRQARIYDDDSAGRGGPGRHLLRQCGLGGGVQCDVEIYRGVRCVWRADPARHTPHDGAARNFDARTISPMP